MYKVSINVETLSPVIVPVTLGEANVVQTGQHLTGSVLLGMFAAEFIRRERDNSNSVNRFHEDDRFFEWFLAGSLKYTPAYPCDALNSGPYLPCPLYLHQGKKDELEIYNILDRVEEETKPIEKYVMIANGMVAKHLPAKKLHFHHRRDNRIAACSEEGGIFNYEALEAGQHFKGSIIGPKHDLESFFEFFCKGNAVKENSFSGRVGRSRNTQYGWVKVTLEEPVILKEELFEHNSQNVNQLYLTLESPVILLNDCGFPEISTTNFSSYLETVLEIKKVKIEKALTRSETIENFVAVWGLKKPLDSSFKAGSVFVLSFPEALSQAALDKLQSLVQTGIGERTHEGYGRFRVTAGLTSSYKLKGKDKPETLTKPSSAMPDSLKALLNQITSNNVDNVIETKANNDAAGYARSKRNTLPSNSLLGRLELIAKAVDASEEDFSAQFTRQIKELRKTAKDQLKRCWDGQINLLVQLENSNEQEKIINDLYKENGPLDALNQLTKETGQGIRNDQGLKNKLIKNYWLTLFRRMRKLNREVKLNEN